MAKKPISEKTVKDILTKHLGKVNAEKVLEKIQMEYNKGTRGKKLAGFAAKEMQAVSKQPADFMVIAVAAVILF